MNVTTLPILIDEDKFFFPFVITPIFFNDESSSIALNYALEKTNKMIFITTSKEGEDGEFYDVGVVGEIMRHVALPDGKIKVLFKGNYRAKLIEKINDSPLVAYIEEIIPIDVDSPKMNATINLLYERLDVMIKLSNVLKPELIRGIRAFEPARVLDAVLNHLSMIRFGKDKIYNIYKNPNIIEQLILLISYIDEEIESLNLQKEIKRKVSNKVEKTNREFYLREHLKQIQKELGSDKEKNEELENYAKKLESIKPHIHEDGYKEIKKQINRLNKMHQDSQESALIQNYIEWMLEIPFGKFATKKLSINAVQKQLDCDHYSLQKPKERIVEYFAVKELLALRGKDNEGNKGTILCFYGPPGVGKTSLANSISKALKRALVRIALGGLEDVNELRGHRRTYLGAMPGRIIQGLIDAKEMNPIIVLDEIDKLSRSYRGDPSAVLLEILDPEQNVAFRDYYANFNIDLSKVVFIATANDISQIPPALRDRMEFIALNSYTPQEKLEIAKKYLIPQELKRHGIQPSEFNLNQNAIKEIIEKYTREAGVRKLREQIAHIMRKSAKMILEGNKNKINISPSNLKNFLDKQVFDIESADNVDKIGVVNGLAWTSVGGDVLKIEAIKIAGKGLLELTGNLGDVMKESAKIALSVNKAMIDRKFRTKEQVYNRFNIHIHVPEGATPKDGPSAGIAMACAIASVLLDKKVDSSLAMTGELTLSGAVLPIGGLKEKLIAAHKAQLKRVLIPEKNYKRDLDEIPDEVKLGLKIIPISNIEEVLQKALVK